MEERFFMKKIIKSAVLVALALTFALTFTACGNSNVSGTKDDPLIAAMEPTFPPFDTTDKNGDLDGFDVDLLNAIAKDQDLVIKWKNMEFDGLIPALDSGNADIVASGVTITKARAKKVDFSDSYYDSGLALAVAKDNSKINSLDDLTTDMIVGAQIGTSGAKKAEELKKEGKIKDVKTYNGLDVTFNDLANGTVDAVINDLPVTKNYIEKQPDKIKIVGDTINAESYGIAVKKGNDKLLEKINDGLKNMKDNGTYDKLYKKWKLGSND
jgi:polar amino acid transport system substrate-binding protein